VGQAALSTVQRFAQMRINKDLYGQASTNREILIGDLKQMLPPRGSEGRLIGIRPYVANKVLESGSEDHGSNDPRRD
jgi:hypothetical protein